MQRNIRIKSTSFVYAPGVFLWVREAIAPFDEKKATEVLEALGLEQADAKVLANPKQEVKTTIDGEDLLLKFVRQTAPIIMTESQISAIRCAYADLVGVMQARDQLDVEVHDWEAHALSIQELAEQFPDILETQNTQNTKILEEQLERYERIAADTKKECHYNKHTGYWFWCHRGDGMIPEATGFASRLEALLDAIEPYLNPEP